MDADGQAADPTAVTLRVKPPAAAATTYTYGVDAALVRDGAGAYHLDVTLDAAGTWAYRWAGTGVLVAAEENVLTARESLFA